MHAPADLAKKRPDLRIDRVHGASAEPDFGSLVDEVRIEGFRLDESVLCFRPAETLIVADLVHNVGRPEQGWSKFYTRAMGFYDRVALSRMIRWTGFTDKAAARRSLDSVLALPFDRMIVGHGKPLAIGCEGRHRCGVFVASRDACLMDNAAGAPCGHRIGFGGHGKSPE